MAKKASSSQKAAVSDLGAGTSDNVVMLPNDVRFDATGQVVVINPKINEFIKESLVNPGSITMQPGSDESIIGLNIFCPHNLNVKCTKKE